MPEPEVSRQTDAVRDAQLSSTDRALIEQLSAIVEGDAKRQAWILEHLEGIIGYALECDRQSTELGRPLSTLLRYIESNGRSDPSTGVKWFRGGCGAIATECFKDPKIDRSVKRWLRTLDRMPATISRRDPTNLRRHQRRPFWSGLVELAFRAQRAGRIPQEPIFWIVESVQTGTACPHSDQSASFEAGGVGGARALSASNAQEKRQERKSFSNRKENPSSLPSSKPGDAQLLLDLAAAVDESRQEIAAIEIRQDADVAHLHTADAEFSREINAVRADVGDLRREVRAKKGASPAPIGAEVQDIISRLLNLGVDAAIACRRRAHARGKDDAWIRAVIEECERRRKPRIGKPGELVCEFTREQIYTHIADNGERTVPAFEPCADYVAAEHAETAAAIRSQRDRESRADDEKGLANLSLTWDDWIDLRRRVGPEFDSLRQTEAGKAQLGEIISATVGGLDSLRADGRVLPAEMARVLLELERRKAADK